MDLKFIKLENKSVNILVTGAAGFIGFHLIQELVKLDYNIVGIDNLNDYYDPQLKLDRLEVLGFDRKKISSIIDGNDSSLSIQNVTFKKIDIVDREIIEKLFKDNLFDIVIHLAAQAGVRYSIENPYSYVDSNLVGFVNILEGCRNSKVKHLLYASSSSVYGMNIKQPFNTHDVVDFPVSLYAATKKSNELMAHSYSHLYGLNTTGLRFFTVYGPFGRPDMAYFSFTKKILSGASIDVFNEGKMQRDFTYIDDIIQGIIGVVNQTFIIKSDNIIKIGQNSHPNNSKTVNGHYKIYNLGNNQPISLRRFISAIEMSCKLKANENLLPMQPGDVQITYANIDESVCDFGYKPKTTIEEGIDKFVKWFRDYYGINQ